MVSQWASDQTRYLQGPQAVGQACLYWCDHHALPSLLFAGHRVHRFKLYCNTDYRLVFLNPISPATCANWNKFPMVNAVPKTLTELHLQDLDVSLWGNWYWIKGETKLSDNFHKKSLFGLQMYIYYFDVCANIFALKFTLKTRLTKKSFNKKFAN